MPHLECFNMAELFRVPHLSICCKARCTGAITSGPLKLMMWMQPSDKSKQCVSTHSRLYYITLLDPFGLSQATRHIGELLEFNCIYTHSLPLHSNRIFLGSDTKTTSTMVG